MSTDVNNPNNVSIISYVFNEMAREGTMDLFGYLETCKYRYGLQTADIWTGMLESTEEDYLRKVKDALDERGLTLVNMAVDGAHIWEDDPATREAHYQRAVAHLKAAEFLGAKTVRIDAGGPRDDEDWTEEQFDEIVKRYTEYVKRAEDNGYKVGPENHWGAAASPLALKRLCETMDSPSFGILLHFGRWHGPEAESGDELVASWAMHTHIVTAMGENVAGPLEMLRDAGYEGCWGIETPSPRYTEIGLWIAKVRDILASWKTPNEG